MVVAGQTELSLTEAATGSGVFTVTVTATRPLSQLPLLSET